MIRTVTIDFAEIERYQASLENYRRQMDALHTQINTQAAEIKFLKEGGEEILVIVKYEDRPDYHEYKTREKTIITDLIAENNQVRHKNDELATQIRLLEQNLVRTNAEIDHLRNHYEKEGFQLRQQLAELEGRGFWARVFNQRVPAAHSPLQIQTAEKIQTAIETKKPRGWHFMAEFVDDEGNVYHKGVLQPHLKGTKSILK